MKTKLFFTAFASLLILSFSACNLDSESNFSPRLVLLTPATINTDSVIDIKNTEQGNLMIDSLHVNDTVTIFVVGDAFANTLTKFNFTIDNNSALEVLVVDSIKRYFDEGASDFAGGKIVMLENIFWMKYPFKFVAKEPKERVNIKFHIESTAENVPNVAEVNLEFPIKP